VNRRPGGRGTHRGETEGRGDEKKKTIGKVTNSPKGLCKKEPPKGGGKSRLGPHRGNNDGGWQRSFTGAHEDPGAQSKKPGEGGGTWGISPCNTKKRSSEIEGEIPLTKGQGGNGNQSSAVIMGAQGWEERRKKRTTKTADLKEK